MSNLEYTGPDGVMSPMGIFNNPGLFLPRYGNVDIDSDCEIRYHHLYGCIKEIPQGVYVMRTRGLTRLFASYGRNCVRMSL